jgi:hypothetical protein
LDNGMLVGPTCGPPPRTLTPSDYLPKHFSSILKRNYLLLLAIPIRR